MIVHIFGLGVLFSAIHVGVLGNIRNALFMNGPCRRNEFACDNGQCISKSRYCNSENNCGDNSDESYCRVESRTACPTNYYACNVNSNNRDYYSTSRKCIPMSWKCDDVSDCPGGEDEQPCTPNLKSFSTISSIELGASKTKAKEWLLKQRNASRFLQKWGVDLPRKAVALYLSDFSLFTDYEKGAVLHEMAYELSSNFLSKIALRKKEDVSTSDLASYLNAFLVACINPRKFYVLDLVAELRKRVDDSDSASAFAILALCNAKDTVTNSDVKKLLDVFEKAGKQFRTDLQAMAVIALSCAAAQSQDLVEEEKLLELTLELKRKQARNGTVENTKTTALVMQALFASEPQSDEENFDEKKAIFQIIRSQDSNGSFGGLTNTYYAIPLFSRLSLLNISSDHCPELLRNEKETLQYLGNQIGEKWLTKYSLLVGDSKDLQRTITLRIPKNISFYEVMKYAADLDDHYKFEYNMRNRKPYIYSLSGLMDDPESELFWTPYHVTNETTMELKFIDKSPVDIIPENNDHLVFWYKKDS